MNNYLFIINPSYIRLKLDIGSKDSCLLYEWLEERLEIQSLADDVLSKYIPTHVNLFYCFGGLIVSAFVFQVSSGLALTIYYRASILDAFDSVKLIMIQIHLGWFIHSLHRWFASNLVIFLFLHISRVFLTLQYDLLMTDLSRYPISSRIILHSEIFLLSILLVYSCM